jgi:hypothetical protein
VGDEIVSDELVDDVPVVPVVLVDRLDVSANECFVRFGGRACPIPDTASLNSTGRLRSPKERGNVVA